MVLAEPDLGRPTSLRSNRAENVYRLHGYRSIHHQEQKHILKGINMKTHQFEVYSKEEIHRLVELLRIVLSRLKLSKEIKDRMPKINSEPGDWGKPFEVPVIFGINEEPQKSIISLTVKSCNHAIMITRNYQDGSEMTEFRLTKKEINCFLDNFIQAYDEGFPE